MENDSATLHRLIKPLKKQVHFRISPKFLIRILSCIVLETPQEQFLCGGNTTTLPPPLKMRKFVTNKRTVDICKHKSVRQDLDKTPMGRITAQFQVEFTHLPFANWVNFVKVTCQSDM